MTNRIERGACFCGALVAQFKGEPFWICYDHDDDCRRATGGALVVWVGYRPEQVRIIAGKPKAFSKTRGIVRTFCAECGTSIGYTDQGLPNESYFALGFFEDPEHFLPQAHAYWQEKLPWLAVADDLPRIEGYSRIRDPAVGAPKDRA